MFKHGRSDAEIKRLLNAIPSAKSGRGDRLIFENNLGNAVIHREIFILDCGKCRMCIFELIELKTSGRRSAHGLSHGNRDAVGTITCEYLGPEKVINCFFNLNPANVLGAVVRN